MCRRSVESAKRTSQNRIELIVYLDDDDSRLAEYKDFLLPGERVIGRPRRSGEAIRLLMDGYADGDMLYFGSDDMTWETKDWDLIFEKHMPEHGLAVLYASMGDSCNPCFTRKWVDTVGLFPAYFKHFGPDTWYADIAKRAGVLVRVPEVKFDHQRVQDATYHRTRADGDGVFAKRMLDETAEKRQKLAEKVKEVLAS